MSSYPKMSILEPPEVPSKVWRSEFSGLDFWTADRQLSSHDLYQQNEQELKVFSGAITAGKFSRATISKDGINLMLTICDWYSMRLTTKQLHVNGCHLRIS